ncbi:MAG: cohesin domain-containing protein [Chlamydiota bacterium]
MKHITWLALCMTLLAAAPAGAQRFSMGSVIGYPGEQVTVAVGFSNGGQTTGFEFGVQYDRGSISFSGASIGAAASAAGINSLRVQENYPGNIDVYGEANPLPPVIRNVNGTVANLKFTISSSATVGASARVSFSGGASYEIGGATWAQAGTGSPGTITIITVPTPTPSGTPPVVALSMVSAPAIVPGENAVLRYRINLTDLSWVGVPSDAYLGVVPPTGGLLYIASHGRFLTLQAPIVKNLLISDLTGDIDFGPLPAEYPTGIYTFYGALTWPGLSPMLAAGRISAISNTRFELLPTPTPTPAPTPTP